MADTTGSELFVVETDDGQAYLGQLVIGNDEHVTVYSGMQGRPPVLRRDDIAAITPATRHPDVIVMPSATSRGRKSEPLLTQVS